MSLHTFGRIKETLPLPPLTEVQLKSFYDFLQLNVLPDKRRSAGLQGAFLEVFPIEEGDGRSRGGSGLVLDFLEYRIDQPKHTPAECRERDLTYQAPMFVKLQLIQRDTGLIKEDSVFLGDLPMMTPDGSFIINGAERVVVSQIHRSPGAYFTVEPRGAKEVVAASIIPMPRRGPWLELEFDNANVLWLKVNKRKFPVTLLLRVLGFNADAVRALMGPTAEALEPTLREDREYAPSEALLHLFSIMRPGEPPREEKAVAFLFNLLADPRRFDLGLPGRYKMNHKLEGVYREMKWKLPKYSSEDYAQTLLSYDPAQAAKSGLYFQDQGIVPTVRYLCGLHLGLPGYEVDDIDHLGNRRVRTVGELLGDTIRLGLGRMARGIRERMLLGAPEAATPQKIVNNRPVVAAIREFFGRSQLSQFKDQLNPLAELRHKRRISALGPGGLTRERAGFDVRDVHRTHYGRICPIETPEGANIGLISHLAAHAKVNDLGFIETPYRKVVKGKVTDEIVYLTADNEDKYIIAQANTKLGKDGVTLEGVRGRVVARVRGDPVLVLPERVELMDVTPKQIVSVSTGLIPFLEHDDANRALMGANMQNQAVPLLRAEPPLVCTGIEDRVALDSGTLVLAEEAGVVSTVGPRLIKVKNGKVEKEYPLTRFTRSNQTTCIDHQPVVRPNQKVQAGDLLADGPASRQGKLALGHNILIAFMPLEGYNFEDAIVISERLVRHDYFTSLHIEKHEIEARDTKLGPERITRDIPNLGEAALRDLGEDGVVRIGAEVRQGDILVGRTSYKGEQEPTPEERLLRSIFGEKAKEVKDSSLRVPSGEGGIVIKTVHFYRDSEPKNAPPSTESEVRVYGADLKPGVREMVRVYVAQKRKLSEGDKLANRHGNKGVVSKILPPEDMPYLPDGTPVDVVLNPLGVPSRMNIGQILETHLGLVAGRRGMAFISPIFDGAKEQEIRAMLEEALIDTFAAPVDVREAQILKRAAKLGVITSCDKIADARRLLARTGKQVLYDGRTGGPIDAPIVVGWMYILKLFHMVEDKMHARSTGPYSLITQQPLGGKAQFGGQRFGEMECWALEAYGAAYTLQEMLTIKSDDIKGRNKAYEAIVQGNDVLEPEIPESFKVLIKELHSLGLDIELLDRKNRAVDIFEDRPRRKQQH